MNYLQYFLAFYFIGYVIYALINGLFARQIIKKMWNAKKPIDISEFRNDPVTIIIPSYNEEVVIVNTIKNMSRLNYPNYKIILVNDGSTDNTMEVLKNEFGLTSYSVPIKNDLISKDVINYYKSNLSNLIVIDKKNGGKADAFNAALNITDTRYVVTVDADTLLIDTALQELMTPVLEDRNVIAVGAQVCVANDSALDVHGDIKTFEMTKNYFFGVQALEYMKTFLIYRTGHNATGATLLISGACGLFSTNVLLGVGGFDTNSVCEDIEITMRIQEFIRKHDLNKRIDFVSNPIAWTEAPSTFRSLAKQRSRWFRGSTQTLWKFKHTLFNPKMGAMGWYSVPAYWLFGYLAPFAQLALLINFAFYNTDLSVLFWGIIAACTVNMITISMMKFTNSPVQTFGDKGRLFWYGLVEALFMQFFLMAVNLKAAIDAMLGKRQWDKFDRVGFKLFQEK